MRIAARIQRIRLGCLVTLEDLEAKTGLEKSFLAGLEEGQEVPTLAMLDKLAEALEVPIQVFFCDTAEPELTPRWTPRLALKELAEECNGPATSVPLSNPKRLILTAIKRLAGRPQEP